MKKILLSLLFVIPLLAYGYTPLFNFENNIPSSIEIKSSMSVSETTRIENDAGTTSNNALSETQNTAIKHEPDSVPVPVALPLLAVAIGLFGFGANRRRV